MTVGIYGVLASVEGEAPMPKNGEAAVSNMEVSGSIYPGFSIDKEGNNFSTSFGFQAVLGFEVELKIK